jgi:hypothetical protein
VNQRGRQTLRALWTAILAVLLVLVVSGLPAFASEAVGEGEVACATDCDGSDGHKQCPPDCAKGACAKVVQGVPTAPPCVVGAALEATDCAMTLPDQIVPCDCMAEVFHPPRA